uniref:Uncharacterized protein n=1 Tax=Lepeophtheirus salmonis TaxID=72036 RepID=A0A0K2URY6_LEPSM
MLIYSQIVHTTFIMQTRGRIPLTF